MKKSLLGFMFLAVLTSCGNTTPHSNQSFDASEESSGEPGYYYGEFSNPLMAMTTAGSTFNGEVADPAVVRDPESGELWCFATNRVTLKSEDGCTWIQVGGEIINFPTWHRESGMAINPDQIQMWAPDVVKIGKKWIYYYSLSNWGDCVGIGYGIADNIGGPYVDQGKLFSYKEIDVENAIDPQVIQTSNGEVWMTFGSFQGIYQVQLNNDGIGLMGDDIDYWKENKILVAGAPTDWDGSQYEGSYVLEHNGKYVYFGSAGTCCDGTDSTYRVMAGISNSVNGPFIDSKGMKLTMSRNGSTYGNLVVWAGSADDSDVYGPGHNSIIKDDAGDYWIYYHAYTRKDGFATRHLMMDKILWDDKGFPYVNTKKPSYDPYLDMPQEGPKFL